MSVYSKYIQKHLSYACRHCPIDEKYVSKRQPLNWDNETLSSEMIPKSKITNQANKELQKIRELQQFLWKRLKEEKFPIEEKNGGAGYSFSNRSWKLVHPLIIKNVQGQIRSIGLSEDYIYTGDPRFKSILNCLNRLEDELKVQLAGLEKGDRGEEYVLSELDLYRGKYRILSNIKLPFEGQKGFTSETDLYVLTKKGILVCEIKNKGNENVEFHISKDGQWAKYDHNGRLLETMESPFAQNARHCIATEQFLERHGIKDYKIIPVIIIGNEAVTIKNEGTNSVIRAFELYNFVEGLSLPEKYDDEYQQKLQDLILGNDIKEDNLFPLQVVPKNLEYMMDKDIKNAFDLMGNVGQFINDYQEELLQIQDAARAEIQRKYKKFKKWALIITCILAGLISFSFVAYVNDYFYEYEFIQSTLIPPFLYKIFEVIWYDWDMDVVPFIFLWNALVWGGHALLVWNVKKYINRK